MPRVPTTLQQADVQAQAESSLSENSQSHIKSKLMTEAKTLGSFWGAVMSSCRSLTVTVFLLLLAL